MASQVRRWVGTEVVAEIDLAVDVAVVAVVAELAAAAVASAGQLALRSEEVAVMASEQV